MPAIGTVKTTKWDTNLSGYQLFRVIFGSDNVMQYRHQDLMKSRSTIIKCNFGILIFYQLIIYMRLMKHASELSSHMLPWYALVSGGNCPADMSHLRSVKTMKCTVLTAILRWTH